jgi:hypothetical protein
MAVVVDQAYIDAVGKARQMLEELSEQVRALFFVYMSQGAAKSIGRVARLARSAASLRPAQRW